jgi:hypothetical protein
VRSPGGPRKGGRGVLARQQGLLRLAVCLQQGRGLLAQNERDCDFRTTDWILSYLNVFIHFIRIINIYIIYIYIKVKIHVIICFWCVWKMRVADPKVSHEVCWSCSKVAVLQTLPSRKRMWRP